MSDLYEWIAVLRGREMHDVLCGTVGPTHISNLRVGGILFLLRRPAIAFGAEVETCGRRWCGVGDPRTTQGSETLAQHWKLSDRATAFDRHGLKVKRGGFEVEKGIGDLRSDCAGSGVPRTTQETRAQHRHNWWLGEILVNQTMDCLTLRLRELETRAPLPKTLHKSSGCFPNSSFGLDARCRLCIVSPMKC